MVGGGGGWQGRLLRVVACAGWLVFLNSLVARSPATAAPRYDAEIDIEAAAGHDDNILLSTEAADGAVLVRRGGLWTGVTPALSLGLRAGGHRLTLSYLGDLRVGADPGRLFSHEVELAARLRSWQGLRITMAAFAGRFDAAAFPEETFRYLGGEWRLRLAATDDVALLGRYRVELRELGAALRDVAHGGEVSLPIGLFSWLSVSPRVSLFQTTPLTDPDGPHYERATAGLDAAAEWLGFRLGLEGSIGTAGLREDRETLWSVGAALRRPLGDHVGLFATAATTRSPAYGQTSAYARRLVTVGLWAGARMASAAPARPPAEDLSPRVRNGRARLRLLAAGATLVTVIGSWDDWATPGVTLRQTRAPDLWEVELPLAAGAHRYRFVVDGRARRPPAAQRYVSDGFGGQDGVVDVDAPLGAADSPGEVEP